MKRAEATYVFEAKSLGYVYPGGITALKSVDLAIGFGERVALVGANGAGKSTLLKLMDGLIFPTSGELTAFGERLCERSLKDEGIVRAFRRRIGFVFQEADVQLFCPTVWDEVTFGPLQLGIPRQEVACRGNEAMALLDILHLRDRPPYLLSGGEKKKVALASVLSLSPDVLLLDEPTAGLDPPSQGNLIDFLTRWADEEKTLIFSTQDLDLVEELASRVLVLGSDHGVVADSAPGRILTDADFMLRNNLTHKFSRRHRELVDRQGRLSNRTHQ